MASMAKLGPRPQPHSTGENMAQDSHVGGKMLSACSIMVASQGLHWQEARNETQELWSNGLGISLNSQHMI